MQIIGQVVAPGVNTGELLDLSAFITVPASGRMSKGEARRVKNPDTLVSRSCELVHL